jgi:nucleotide-binding universal stress UspA family protein
MNIVLGYDGSDSARRALEKAAELVNGGTITCVAAVRLLGGKGGLAYSPIELEDYAAALREAKERLQELHVDARTMQGRGDPAGVITAEALEEHADLVVVGSEHKNVLERLLFGSVSDGVLHRAKTDVLVVA